MGFDAIDRQFRKAEIKLECMRCSATSGVEMESSRTAYHFDGPIDSPDNPNRPIPLCRLCAKEHHEYWTGMWADYQSMTR